MPTTWTKIFLRRRESKTVTVTVTDANGDAVDLTGYAIKFRVETPTPITKSLAEGTITCSTPASGVFTVPILPADTAAASISGVRAFMWEAVIVSAGSVATIVGFGAFEISEELIPA